MSLSQLKPPKQNFLILALPWGQHIGHTPVPVPGLSAEPTISPGPRDMGTECRAGQWGRCLRYLNPLLRLHCWAAVLRGQLNLTWQSRATGHWSWLQVAGLVPLKSLVGEFFNCLLNSKISHILSSGSHPCLEHFKSCSKLPVRSLLVEGPILSHSEIM